MNDRPRIQGKILHIKNPHTNVHRTKVHSDKNAKGTKYHIDNSPYRQNPTKAKVYTDKCPKTRAYMDKSSQKQSLQKFGGVNITISENTRTMRMSSRTQFHWTKSHSTKAHRDKSLYTKKPIWVKVHAK